MNPGDPNAKQRVRLQLFLIEIAVSHLQHAVDKHHIGYKSESTAHPAVMYRAGAGDGASFGAKHRVHVRTFAPQIREREAEERA
jgi:hypothetical protein